MEYIKIRNWNKFQNYKDRRPPWIRLYNTLLDRYDDKGDPNPWRELSGGAAKLLVGLWLLASKISEQRGGLIPNKAKFIEEETGANPKFIPELVISGLILLVHGDIDTLAPCKHDASNCPQDAIPERARASTETETETETENNPPTPRKRGKPAGAGADVVEIPDTLKSDQEFMSTWERWKRHRSQLRKPLTTTCEQTQLNEFARHGPRTARLMIEQSIKHGWQGIFELKDGAPVAPGSRSGSDHDPDADLTARGAPAGEEEPMTPEEEAEIRRTDEEAEAMRGFIRQGYGRERLDQAMDAWRKARDAPPDEDDLKL